MKIKSLRAACALGVVALGAFVADGFTTLVLFVVLTPVTLVVTAYFGMHALMLGDGEPRSAVSLAAVYTAVLGPPLGTLAVNIGAMFLAHGHPGPTFWVPLAAAAVNVVLTVGVLGLAGVLVEVCR